MCYPASFKPLQETYHPVDSKQPVDRFKLLPTPLYDNRSSKYFLVDTVSELSVIPPSRSDTQKTCSRSLIAANGSPIKTFGTRQMMLNLGLQKYSWRFIIADVTQPIMGADFLRSHSLLVDLANEQLMRTDNLKTIKGSRSGHKSFHISSIKPTNEFADMLRNCPELTTPTFSFDLPKHGVLHRIPTTGFPVHCQARRLSPEKLKIA